MDLGFNDDQRALQAAVGRFVGRDYDFLSRERRRQLPAGWDPAAWDTLAELGLVGLTVPEAFGGMGATPTDVMAAAQALGPALLLEPWTDGAVVAARALQAAGGVQSQHWLERIAGHADIVVLALDEPEGCWPVLPVHTRAVPDAGGFRLSGRKLLVPHAASARVLLVPARTAAEPGAHDGVSLFAVDPHAVGVSMRSCRTHDSMPVADVRFDGVRLGHDALLGELHGAWPALRAAVAHGIAATAAEAVGLIELLLAQTVEHLKTRRQFGQPLAQFQVLRHAAVDMLIALEQVRSMAWLAAAAFESSDAAARDRAIAEVKLVVGRQARHAAEVAVQLHGAIGLTDECVVSHAFRRLMAIDLRFGSADLYQAVLARDAEVPA